MICALSLLYFLTIYICDSRKGQVGDRVSLGDSDVLEGNMLIQQVAWVSCASAFSVSIGAPLNMAPSEMVYCGKQVGACIN